MDLKININDIPPEGLDIPISLTPEEAEAKIRNHSGAETALNGPLTGKLAINATGKRILARGSISAKIRTACARCLEDFDHQVSENIFVVYIPRSDRPFEEESESEDPSQEYYSGEEIDLWPVIYEHLMLSLPIQTVCRDDCQGICPVCGLNRNTNPCRCRTDSGHPGLAGLQAIKDKLPS